MLSFFTKNLESLRKIIRSPFLIFSFLFIFGSASHAQTVQVVVITGAYLMSSAAGGGGAPGGGGGGGCSTRNCYSNEYIPTDPASFNDDIVVAAKSTDVRCTLGGTSRRITSQSSRSERLGAASALANNPTISGAASGYATLNGKTTFRAVYADGGSETWYVASKTAGGGVVLLDSVASFSPGDGVVKPSQDCPNQVL
jgi:hypothetical protein